MQTIVEKLKQALILYLISNILTKENVQKWISEALDSALEKAKASPSTIDDPIVQKIHDIWEEIASQ